VELIFIIFISLVPELISSLRSGFSCMANKSWLLFGQIATKIRYQNIQQYYRYIPTVLFIRLQFPFALMNRPNACQIWCKSLCSMIPLRERRRVQAASCFDFGPNRRKVESNSIRPTHSSHFSPIGGPMGMSTPIWPV
jgi:hypothetical protein